MPTSSSDRNLLFGILAVQMDFISRDALIEAMNAWVLEKSRALDELLVERGWLKQEHRQLLEPLVEAHIRQHGGDPQKSLAALSSIESIRQELRGVGDADVGATLQFLTGTQDDAGTVGSTDREQAPPDATRGAQRRFRIIRPYAKGGLGEVFVARDEELQREVALKEILNEQARNAQSRERFVREAEITGGLEHPGIVPVYGLGHYDDGRPYYAMRFIRGASLKEAIDEFHTTQFMSDRDRNLKLRELLGRFIDVCNAIEYAHSRGVLHRDLKPGNIMLGKYGETLVVDWGLAKVVGRSETHQSSAESTLSFAAGSKSGSSETLPGSAIGTPAYMSPEQAHGKLDELGPATDVYSLGATLYMQLVGNPPFEGSAVEVLEKVREGKPTPPHAINRRVPKALSAICTKAMQSQPRLRYASCAALAEDVQRWLADESIVAAPDSLPARFARWARRHRAAVAAAFILLAAGMVGLAINRLLVGVEQGKTLQALGQARVAEAAAERSRVEAVKTAASEAEARKQAVEQQRRAEESELIAKRNGYFAEVARAQRAFQDGNVAEVFDMLQRVEPKPNQPDFRGFEYFYLWRACNESHRTLRGHVSVVTDVDVSPDGRTVASIAADTTVTAWDIATGRRAPVLQDSNITSMIDVEFSPDGKLLAVGVSNSRSEGEIRLLEAGNWKHLRTVKAHSGQLLCLAFFPDGSRIASVGTDNKLCITDVASGSLVRDVGLGSVPWSVAVSPDGNLVAVGLGTQFGFTNSYHQYFDVSSDELSQPQTGHTAAVYSVAFSPDGKTLATASGDWTARLWDVEARTAIHVLRGHNGSVNRVEFSPDGKSLATASGDRTVIHWDAASGQQLATFRAHQDSVSAVVFTPDGKTLVTGSSDRTIRLIPVEGRDYLALEPPKRAAADSPLFKALKMSSELLDRANIVFSVDFSPDRRRIAVGRMALPGAGRVEIWDIASRKIIREIVARPPAIACISAISRDGKYLAIGEMFRVPFGMAPTSYRARVLIQEFESGKEVVSWQLPCDAVTALAFSPDGGMLVVGHSTGGISIGEIGTGSLGDYVTNGSPVATLAFHPDGRRLLVGRPDETARVFDTHTRKDVAEFPHPEVVAASAFSPDGKTLATATARSTDQKYLSSGTIYLWDFESRTIRRKLTGHTQFIRFVRFTSDGQRLVSVGGDGTAKVWDAETGREVLSLRSPRPGYSGAISADGLMLAMGQDDGSVRIWSAEQGVESKIAWYEGLLAKAVSSDSWDAALEHIDRLIELRPKDGTLRYQRGRANWELGNLDLAKADWEQAWLDIPKTQMETDFGYWVGSMYVEVGSYEHSREYQREERAFGILAEAYRLAGPSALLVQYMVQRGNTQLALLKEEDRAIETYREAIAVQRELKEKKGEFVTNPQWDPTRMLSYAGMLRHERAQYDQAESLFQEALKAREAIHGEKQDSHDWHVTLVRLYRDTGRLDEARKSFETAFESIEQASMHPVLRRRLERERASLLRQLGDEDAARKVVGSDVEQITVKPLDPAELAPAPADQVHGLQASFYAGAGYPKKLAERVDPLVDFIWWNHSAHPDVPEQNFAVRWTGWLRPRTPGVHRLNLLVDGGAGLWIDTKLVCGWTNRELENNFVEVDLSDEPHFVQIYYFNPARTRAVMLQWILPGSDVAVAVPPECWFLSEEAARANNPAAPEAAPTEAKHGLKAELFRGCNFEQRVGDRIDPQVHFFWERDPPGPGMPADYFSIRWTGKLIVPKDGSYQIWLEGDDGFRMYLDGDEHNNSFTGGPQYWSENTPLKAGPHDIVVEFREGFGSAWISLRWQLYGEDGFPEEPIPPVAFLLPDQ